MRTLVFKGAHVLSLNRPSERATKACEQVEQECAEKEGTGKITQIACDLQSFESARTAGKEVLSVLDGQGLDALVIADLIHYVRPLGHGGETNGGPALVQGSECGGHPLSRQDIGTYLGAR